MKLRVLPSIAALSLIAILLPLTAGANTPNYFGVREFTSLLVYGNISSIVVPTSTAQPANPNAMYLHRSLVVNTDSSLQVQAGFITVGSYLSFDNCGNTSSDTYAFSEVWTGSINSAVCHFFGRYYAPTSINFNVFVNSSGWNDKINGILDPFGHYHPGFASGIGGIGGESAFYSTATGLSSTEYGAGPVPWGYYTAPTSGGSGWIQVVNNSSTTTILTGGWTIDPAPTPLWDHYYHS